MEATPTGVVEAGQQSRPKPLQVIRERISPNAYIYLDMPEKLLNLFKQKPKLAILMSGAGSNARVLLENRRRYLNLNFAAIVTDNPNSSAETLAAEFGLLWKCFPGAYKGKENRQKRFEEIAAYLEKLKIDALIYSGFMKISPVFFVEKFPGLNIHPADLTIKDNQGIPRYKGINAVQLAIENGEKTVASTVHIVDRNVDCGAPIAISAPLHLSHFPGLSHEEIHEKLKIKFEHTLFPAALEMLSKGNIRLSDLPVVIVDNKEYFLI